jgi:hypothetical protein
LCLQLERVGGIATLASLAFVAVAHVLNAASKKDLSKLEEKVATKADISRLETKLDNIRTTLWNLTVCVL